MCASSFTPQFFNTIHAITYHIIYTMILQRQIAIKYGIIIYTMISSRQLQSSKYASFVHHDFFKTIAIKYTYTETSNYHLKP